MFPDHPHHCKSGLHARVEPLYFTISPALQGNELNPYPVVHVAHVAHAGHCGHIAPAGQVFPCGQVAPIPADIDDAMIFPLALVPSTVVFGKFAIVIPPPTSPSRVIPTRELLLPSLVRNTFWIYCTAFGAIVPISNALAINNIHDIHRKNKVAHFMKPILFLFVCK
ncbi:MAG: hypothetical protein WCL02_09965, partial [bacterium]